MYWQRLASHPTGVQYADLEEEEEEEDGDDEEEDEGDTRNGSNDISMSQSPLMLLPWVRAGVRVRDRDSRSTNESAFSGLRR